MMDIMKKILEVPMVILEVEMAILELEIILPPFLRKKVKKEIKDLYIIFRYNIL
jgi:hypothetical protein